jgi:tRNA/tmRNA/rRNA uracil-C5-methylase (TrmA/RlmC/RlmD family)
VARGPDGRVVFVPFTAPGDRIRARVVEERRSFLRARALELVVPGPGRTDPLCAVFGSCGGCDWQHLDYEAQLEAKRSLLRDAFERIAKLRLDEPLAMVASPSPYGYRARARVRVERGRVGFRRRRSHALCATARCPVLAAELDGALAALAAEPPAREGEWELALGSDGVALTTALPPVASPPAVDLRVGDASLRVSAGVFTQASAPLRGALAEAVAEAAGRGERLLELHAGAGFFTLGLARRFEQVVAVESAPAAIADLEFNLARAGCSRARVLATTAEEALTRDDLREPPPDVIVLDPPRDGLGRGGADALARLGARRIVYVSCDPATLARDSGVCADRGYALVSIRGLDLFPQTAHLESVAVLERE